ncbi:MAG: hypothetical protein N4A33_12155 [Bacteriovoracaceae bacterium]|jgi:hypothetical protein|nr:hypothetical protein [Bacteriovoracaceae bacterium]
MKKIIMLIILFTCLQNQSLAGLERGNGGDFVICKQDGVIQSVNLLDYYEGEVLRNAFANFGDETESLDEMVYHVLDRVKKFDLNRYQMYLTWYKTFFQETKFISNVTFYDVKDSFHLFFKKNCGVQQVAYQRTKPFSWEKRYIINKDLWDIAPLKVKAGLVLHEIFYREALSYSHTTDSVLTRRYNSILSSEEFETFTKVEYINLLSSTRLSLDDFIIKRGSRHQRFVEVQDNYTNYALVCRDGNQIISAKAFDITQGSYLSDFNMILDGEDIRSSKDRAISLVKRLSFLKDFKLIDNLTFYIKSFDNRIKQISDINIELNLFEQMVVSSKNCRLEGVIAHFYQDYSYSKSTIINKDIWNALDENSRAAIIIHDAVVESLLYKSRWCFNCKKYFSKKAREITSLLISKEVMFFDREEVKEFVGIMWKEN